MPSGMHICIESYSRHSNIIVTRSVGHTCITQFHSQNNMHTGRYTYIHTYIRTYVRTYIHTYIRTYVHTYIRTYVHTYIRTYVHTYIRTYVHTRTRAHTRTCMHTFLVLNIVMYTPNSPSWANTGVSFSRLECGVHDWLHIYPLCGIFYLPWHRHQIEGTNGV